MQTLSPQPTISSLPFPKKPTIFENPLERPEIGTPVRPQIPLQPTVPSVDSVAFAGLVATGEPAAQTKESPKDAGVTQGGAVSSSSDKPLPFLQKPKNSVPPETRSNAPVRLPAPSQPIAPTRRKLSDEIKKIFERSSEDFTNYAKNSERNDEENAWEKKLPALNKALDKMDDWDRALLLGEYPAAAPEQPKPKRLSFAPTPSVPKKTDAHQIGAAFPSRVMDEEITTPVRRTEFHHPAPTKHVDVPVFRPQEAVRPTPATQTLPISATPAIPLKPKGPANSVSDEAANKKPTTPLLLAIPLKPKQPVLNIAHPPTTATSTDSPAPTKHVDVPVFRPQEAVRPTPATQTLPIPATPAIPLKPKGPANSVSDEVANKKPTTPILPTIPLKSKSLLNSVPDEAANKKPTTPLLLAIPLKPKQPVLNIAHPPTTATSTDSPAAPPPNMSETLVEKIIEGQMRGVFENAPPLLQKELEKITVQEIMSSADKKAPDGNIENEVWRKRLREYLIKLKGQAVSVFSDIKIAEPLEGEFVLDYVKRVYPILLKAQVMKK